MENPLSKIFNAGKMVAEKIESVLQMRIFDDIEALIPFNMEAFTLAFGKGMK